MQETKQEAINTTLLLSLQSALLGMITPNIRAVYAHGTDSLVTLYFIFDGHITREEIEEASCIETEVSVDFMTLDETVPFETRCLQVDYPTPVTCPGVCAYRRKEGVK